MNKFATGMVLGGLVAFAGAEYMMMNSSARKKIMKNGKKVLHKAEDMMEDMSGNDMW